MMRHVLRKQGVRDKMGLSVSTIDRKERAFEFPQRVRLGKNSVGWFEDEVDDWLARRQRGRAAPPTLAIEANPLHRHRRAKYVAADSRHIPGAEHAKDRSHSDESHQQGDTVGSLPMHKTSKRA